MSNVRAAKIRACKCAWDLKICRNLLLLIVIMKNYFVIRTFAYHLKNFNANMSLHCTEVRFASLLSGGFITAIVVNPSERKLAKHTSVHWAKLFAAFIAIHKEFLNNT